MRLLINRKVVDGAWGGGNAFVRAFRELMPLHGHTVVDSLADRPDLIILVGPERDTHTVGFSEAMIHRLKHPGCKIILRVNDCDARKGTQGVDSKLMSIGSQCDGIVFVSTWLKDYMMERWHTDIAQTAALVHRHGVTFDADTYKNNLIQIATVIHNGVDRSLFRPVPFEENNLLRVVAHHWSDNSMKGRDVYEALDRTPGIEFTYIGRHKCNFTGRRTNVLPPLTGEPLARALAANRVYVSGSLWDPGPNHVLEALSCGITTWVHRNGGGAVEFAGSDHTYGSVDELRSILFDHRRVRAHNTYVPTGWDECITQYARVFEGVVSK